MAALRVTLDIDLPDSPPTNGMAGWDSSRNLPRRRYPGSRPDVHRPSREYPPWIGRDDVHSRRTTSGGPGERFFLRQSPTTISTIPSIVYGRPTGWLQSLEVTRIPVSYTAVGWRLQATAILGIAQGCGPHEVEVGRILWDGRWTRNSRCSVPPTMSRGRRREDCVALPESLISKESSLKPVMHPRGLDGLVVIMPDYHVEGPGFDSLRGNKLTIHNMILKPTWTYGIELWGSARKSNIDRIQSFQSKTLAAPCPKPSLYARYASNHFLKKFKSSHSKLETRDFDLVSHQRVSPMGGFSPTNRLLHNKLLQCRGKNSMLPPGIESGPAAFQAVPLSTELKKSSEIKLAVLNSLYLSPMEFIGQSPLYSMGQVVGLKRSSDWLLELNVDPPWGGR
ncbi:hypothetical protein AAG570_007279 [Ranatra chinensis]|uniref:Uncharacterized protein n=1 Tax=Ranatra chinensis TaxID=642074 RepID=A0ABD0Y8G8_9HEMI